MNSSFKPLTTISAIGLSIYTCFLVVLRVIHILDDCPYQFNLVQDICQRIGMDIVLIALLIAGIALLQYCPLSRTSKSFRIYTIVLALLLFATAIICAIPFTSIYINGVHFFYPNFVWRIVLLILSIIWMVMLSRQEATERTSLSFRIVICCGMIALCIPMLLEIISGVSLLCSGKILFLHSSCIRSWVRYFVPTVILCWYSMAFYIRNHPLK